jgi:hypothetical protein
MEIRGQLHLSILDSLSSILLFLRALRVLRGELFLRFGVGEVLFYLG